MLEALVAVLMAIVAAAVLVWAFIVVFGMLFTMPIAVGGAIRDYRLHHRHTGHVTRAHSGHMARA